VKIGDLAQFKHVRNENCDFLGWGTVLDWDTEHVKVAFILDPKGWNHRWITKELMEIYPNESR
jgi:hypothetical protein